MLTKNVERVLQSILKVENTFLEMEKLASAAGSFLKRAKLMKMMLGNLQFYSLLYSFKYSGEKFIFKVSKLFLISASSKHLFLFNFS